MPKLPVSTSGSGGGLNFSVMARGQEQTHAVAVYRAYDGYRAAETYFELGLGEAEEFVGEVVRAIIEGLRDLPPFDEPDNLEKEKNARWRR